MKKDWVARELTIEVVVGAFMVMILLGLAYFTIIIGKHRLFQPTYRMEIVFGDVMGLKEGDKVMVRGLPVGKVEDLQLEDTGVHVIVRLEENIDLRQDYAVSIMASSVLGGRHLSIEEGSHDSPDICEDRILIGEEPYDLMADASELMSALKKNVVEEGGIVDNLKGAVAKLNDVMTRISGGEGALGKLVTSEGKLYDDLGAVVASFRDVAEKLKEGEGTIGKLFAEEKLYNDLSSLASRLDNIAAGIEGGKGNVGMLVGREDLYTNLAATVKSAKAVMAKVEKGEGMIGKLVNDDELYREIKYTVQEARAAIDDMRETTPVVTFTSVFFGAF
jgi:phospholipid/cholesterol/gamma-HCH transport system substrate-binding protein